MEFLPFPGTGRSSTALPSSDNSQNEPPKLRLEGHCPLSYHLYYGEEFASITFPTPFQIGCWGSLLCLPPAGAARLKVQF